MIRLDLPLWAASLLIFTLAFLPALVATFAAGLMLSGRICP